MWRFVRAAAVTVVLLAKLGPTLGDEAIPNPLATIEELQWRENEDGSFSSDLYMDVTVIAQDGEHKFSMITRAYGSSPDTLGVPGPTIAMKACNTYKLTLHNLLQRPSPAGEWNAAGSVNTTNLHLHGLHISGMAPGDEVFTTVVKAEESYEYTYVIPCDHAGGLFFYHAHYHGSMGLQVGGGATGMVKIEYNDWEDIPEQISSMPQIAMQMKEMMCNNTHHIQMWGGDEIFACNRTLKDENFFLVNGHVQPDIAIELGQWHHVRLSFVSAADPYQLTVMSDTCDVELMATDGVWLGQVPRKLANGTMFVAPASRLDYALRCREVKKVGYVAWKMPVTDRGREPVTLSTVTAMFNVFPAENEDGNPKAIQPPLDFWNPCRPYYLMDVRNEPPAVGPEPFKVKLNGGGHNGNINGMQTRPATGTPDGDFIGHMGVDEIQHWRIKGSQEHSLHMHMNHFQIFHTGSSEMVGDWYRAGDWYDTVQGDHDTMLEVKFRTDRFGGPVAVHCHVLDHSDYGIMVASKIDGGQGALADPSVQHLGTCDIPLEAASPPNRAWAGPAADAAQDSEEPEEDATAGGGPDEEGSESSAVAAESDSDAAAESDVDVAPAAALDQEEVVEDADVSSDGSSGGGASWGMALVGVLAVAGVLAGFAWVRRRRRRRTLGRGRLADHRVPIIFDEAGPESGIHGGGGGGLPGPLRDEFEAAGVSGRRNFL